MNSVTIACMHDEDDANETKTTNNKVWKMKNFNWKYIQEQFYHTRTPSTLSIPDCQCIRSSPKAKTNAVTLARVCRRVYGWFILMQLMTFVNIYVFFECSSISCEFLSSLLKSFIQNLLMLPKLHFHDAKVRKQRSLLI